MAKVLKVNHTAIVVGDMDASLSFWRDALGLKLDHTEDVPSQKAQVAFLPMGDTEVELVKPTSDESGVAKFLAERGGGMHHLCFEVDDITGMMTQMKDKGVRLIGETATDLGDRRIVFIHPKSTGGVLVELVEYKK
jgi:methylmalonyl-CoA/ethylmalonyl-CoA epimerase